MNIDKRKGLQTALAYVQQGKLDQAIAEYQAILEAEPNNCNVLNALGDLSARVGNKTEAIAHFMRLGEVYRGDGLYVRAVALYKKVVKLAPMHIEASSACAELYAEQGLIAEAKLQFQGLADHYLNRGDLSRTMEIYEKIIRMDPGHRPTLSKVVKVLVRPGQVGEALSELNALGMRLVEAGQIEDARQIYQGAVEFLRSQGRAAEAKSFTDALNSLPPGEEEALAAAFPGDGDDAKPVGIVTEETTPLEIFPGFSVGQEEVLALELESPVLEQEVPVLAQESPVLEQQAPPLNLHEELGGWFEIEPEGVVSPDDDSQPLKGIVEQVEDRVTPDEMVQVDVSIGEEAESGGEAGPTTIELERFGGSDELVTLAEQPASPVERGDSQTLAGELQEARFFLQQGMLREAQAIFQRILLHKPEYALAKQHLAEVERLLEEPTREESPPSDVKKASVSRGVDARAPRGDYVDLGAELIEELGRGEPPLPPGLEPRVERMLSQLGEGIHDQLDVTDYETHYNLGMAYRDLELYDQAIEELRLAANDAAYRVRCASLLGLCYLAKSEPERSIEELLKGLAATEAGTEERWGILYDLATAYEALGNAKKALEALVAIYSEAPRFRDIRVRVRDLRGRFETGR